jgi:hypothetical protein
LILPLCKGKKEEPAAKETKEPGFDAAGLEASSEKIRETAQWLIATFGAVAGAVIVGLELSDIGKLKGFDRTLAAIAAFGALAAVIGVIAQASRVLARPRVPLSELSSTAASRRYRRLRAQLNRNRGLYGGYGSVGGLVDRVEAEWNKQLKSWDEMNSSDDPEVRAKAQRENEETQKVMPELNKLNRRLMAVARAEDIRITFEYVRYWIIGLAVVVALGAAVFAYVDSAPDPEETPAVSQKPVAAQLTLTASGREKVSITLGSDCPLARVPVQVLASSEDGWEVVSVAAEGCKTALLTIGREDGEVQPVETVDLTLPPAG